MSDPTEDICVAQVDWLNDATNFSPSLAIQFRAPVDPSGELELETPNLRGMFFPYAETEEKIGRGGEVLETFTTSLLVVRQMTPQVNRQELNAFVREVRSALRGVSMAGYRYVSSEVVAKFNPEALHERNQFESVVRFTYLGTA